MVSVSVIIPVKNGGSTLERCLTSLSHQTIADELEIIVLDSSSSDNSLAIATSFGAKIINIPNETFNHGLTRNRGVEEASGKLLYFTVQDAWLPEVDQLEKMANLFKDQELKAVVGMQAVPHEDDKNPAKWFQRFSSPTVVFKQYKVGFESLSSKDQLANAGEWDNVNAMYRKSVLMELPFINTNFAEDKFWAIDALKKGFKLAFDPSLLVFHYHHHNFRYSFRVQYIINYNYYKFGKFFPAMPPYAKPVLGSVYRVVKNSRISFFKKVYWSLHNISGHTGIFLSNAIFNIAGKVFGESALHKTYNLFCKNVPQGKIKNN